MKATIKIFVLAAAMGLVCMTPMISRAVCFVNGVAKGKNDGTSWTDAYTNPQFALINAACTEIWVAKGLYLPTSGSDRTVSFVVRSGVNLYGGFAGTETTRDQREPAIYTTILSGDLGKDDANATTTQIDATSADIRGENSYHVLMIQGTRTKPTDGSTVIDGFTVTGGQADSTSPDGEDDRSGGGLFCEGSDLYCRPTLRNVLFSGNFAANFGAAIYNDGTDGGDSSPQVFSAVFTGNSADLGGGAVYDNAAKSGSSSPVFTNVSFIANKSGSGGAVYNTSDASTGDDGSSTPSFTNVAFLNNTAQIGGAVYNAASDGGVTAPEFQDATFSGNIASDLTLGGGAVYSNSARSKLTNSTFNQNSAHNGGAFYVDGSDVDGSGSVLLNVTLSGNTATANGAAIYFTGRTASRIEPDIALENTILWGDTVSGVTSEMAGTPSSVTIDHSVIQNGCPSDPSFSCTNIFTTDPLLNPLAENGGYTRTMVPSYGSSAIDDGLDSACPLSDQRGLARPQGPHCDIGAVEAFAEPPPVAQPQSVIVFEDVSKQITLVGTDSNPGGPFTFTYTIVRNATHGGVFTGTGAAVTYTPMTEYVGPDSFDFTVTDSNGTSLPATVTIQVIGGPPIVESKNFYIPENTSLDITLYAKDNDTAGGPYTFTFAMATSTSDGTAVLSGNTVRYTPNRNFVGNDQFTYTATDVNGTSIPGTMNITVHPGPVAFPSSTTIPHDTTGEITFSAADHNPGGPFAYAYALTSNPSHGSLSSISGNKISYTPKSGFTGKDSFTYSVTDDNGTSPPALVSITVLPSGGGNPPLPPSAIAIPSLNTWGYLILSSLLGIAAWRVFGMACRADR